MIAAITIKWKPGLEVGSPEKDTKDTKDTGSCWAAGINGVDPHVQSQKGQDQIEVKVCGGEHSHHRLPLKQHSLPQRLGFAHGPLLF